MLLGGPAQVARFPGNASSLREACERAQQRREGMTLVVGSEVRDERSGPSESSARDGPHDGGFAWAFAPEGALDVSELLGVLAPGKASPLEAALSVAHDLADRFPAPLGEGTEEEGSRPSQALGREPGADADRLRSVSEGAYVPRPRYLETLPSRWRFVAEHCGACGAYTFPTRRRCRACGRTEDLETRELPRDGGVVVATTVIGRGGQPTEFDPVVEAFGPYQVVLSELVPGARVPLQVTDAVPGEIHIGDRVDTRLRRLYAMEGEWRYGRKAVPARPSVPTPA